MNPVAFQIFGLSIKWYGILIASGILIGAILAIMECRRIKFDENYILDIILICVPSAIVGARLYYVIFQWSYYKNNLLEIFAIRNGGLAIYGGIIAAVAAAYIYTHVKNIEFLKVADICTPSIILGQAIGRWGNFFNQEAYGGTVSYHFIKTFPQFIQDQMFIGGAYHQPTFLYESLWDIIGFILLMVLNRRNHKNGLIFFAYLIYYSIGRCFIEGLRTDSLMLGNIRVSQLLSVLLVILGIAGIFLIYRKKDKTVKIE